MYGQSIECRENRNLTEYSRYLNNRPEVMIVTAPASAADLHSPVREGGESTLTTTGAMRSRHWAARCTGANVMVTFVPPAPESKYSLRNPLDAPGPRVATSALKVQRCSSLPCSS